jgi:hypothetical protein
MKTRWVQVFAAVCLLPLIGCASTAKPTKGILASRTCGNEVFVGEFPHRRIRSVKRTIRYSASSAATDGDLLPNARIFIIDPADVSRTFECRSNENGEFSADRVPPGNYHVVVCAEGFINLEGDITVAADGSEDGLSLLTVLNF